MQTRWLSCLADPAVTCLSCSQTGHIEVEHVTGWCYSNSSFHHTFVGFFSHWFVVVRNVSSVPPYAFHFLFTVCANKPPTRINVLKVSFIWVPGLLYVCCTLTDTSFTYKRYVKWHLRASLDESCVQIASCHQLSPLTDGSLQSLKWIWSLQLFDMSSVWITVWLLYV